MKGLNKILLQIVLLFGVLVFSTEIRSENILIPDSCTGIHYSNNQDKRCLECLINSPKKDSLIQNYTLQFHNFKEVIMKQNLMYLDLDFAYSNEREKSGKLELKLGRARRNIKIGIGISFVGGIAGGIYLFK